MQKIVFSAKLDEYEESTGKLKPVEIFRVGLISDRDLNVEMSMLKSLEKNFKNNVYGQEIPVNLDHFAGEAQGWFKDCYIEGESLFALIEWTEAGKEKIEKGLYKYVSVEIIHNYKDSKEKFFDYVLTGLALTNNPALKNQKPIELKENINYLTNKNMDVFKVMLAELQEKETITLAELNTLKSAFEELGEQGEEVKAEVEALEDKVEGEAEEKKDVEGAEGGEPEAEPAEEAEQPAEPVEENLSEKQIYIQLKEKNAEIMKMNEEIKALKFKERKREIEAQFKEVALISDEKPTGLTKENFAKLVELASSLSENQSETLLKLFKTIVKVDVGAIGESNSQAEQVSGQKQIELAKKEANEMHLKTKKPLSECLTEAYRKYNLNA